MLLNMCLQTSPPPHQPPSLSISHRHLEETPTCAFNASVEPPLDAPPNKLTRVLYLPRHTSNTTHLPLHDISARYKSAVQDALFGSSFYYFKLWFMERPRGDGLDVPVDYLVNMNPDAESEKRIHIRVEKRALLREDDALVDVSIPLPPGEECLISEPSEDDEKSDPTSSTTMTVSNPLQPSRRGDYRIPHPYFAFRLKNMQDGPDTLVEWQVHPGPNSLFRYVLVELGTDSSGSVSGSASSHKPLNDRILAIYQHIGLVVWLPTDFSEGLLLLPERDQSRDHGHEAVVVASLLGLLYQIRELKHMQPQRVQTLAGSAKLFKKMLSKVKSPGLKSKGKAR